MAYIEKRKRQDKATAYRVIWREGGHREAKRSVVTVYDDTKAKRLKLAIDEARQYWPSDEALRRLDLGEFCETPPEPAAEEMSYSVAVYCEMYLEAIFAEGRVRGRNQNTMMQQLEDHIEPFVGHLDMAELNSGHIRDWQRTLATLKRTPTNRKKPQVLSPKTISNIRASILAPALAAACDPHNELGLPQVRADNPILYVAAPKIPAKGGRDSVENEEEARILVTAMYATGYKVEPFAIGDIVAAILVEALRAQEAVARRCLDVYPEGRYSTISGAMKWPEQSAEGGEANRWAWEPEPKTAKGWRRTPMAPSMMAMYRRRTEGRPRTAPCFSGPGGGFWPYSTLYHRFQKGMAIARTMGLDKNLNLRDLRYSGGSLMRRKGFDLETIRQVMGHKHISTTSAHYQDQLTDAEMAAASARMDPIASAALEARKRLRLAA